MERGLCESREKAQRLVMSGQVLADGQKLVKPSDMVGVEADLTVGTGMPYVSRGGLKLEKALKAFNLKVDGLTVLDVGSSTGGFTDCLLQNGAAGVTAVDVGKGQLDWKLRNDPRVTVLEKQNARYLTAEQVPEPVDLVTMDVSFISVSKIFPAVFPLLKPGGYLVCLIKPQFEAGREQVGKKGVVSDSRVHLEVIERVVEAAGGHGFHLHFLDFSPIKGPAGNVEFLAGFHRERPESQPLCAEVVQMAHEVLS